MAALWLLRQVVRKPGMVPHLGDLEHVADAYRLMVAIA
jgi:hypothetical protein